MEIESIKKLWRIPRGLGEHGKVFYKKAGEYLVKKEILTELDKTMFEGLCRQYDFVMNMKECLNKELPNAKNRRESEKKKILISSYRETLLQFEELSAQFYLRSEIRAKLKIDPNLSLVKKGRK